MTYAQAERLLSSGQGTGVEIALATVLFDVRERLCGLEREFTTVVGGLVSGEARRERGIRLLRANALRNLARELRTEKVHPGTAALVLEEFAEELEKENR